MKYQQHLLKSDQGIIENATAADRLSDTLEGILMHSQQRKGAGNKNKTLSTPIEAQIETSAPLKKRDLKRQ